MKHESDLAKGWILKGDSDLANFKNLALEELPDYAVSVRYDFEFWPDVKTAVDAIEIVEYVRAFVLSVLDLKQSHS